jgi:hypothetical protein
MALFKTLKVSTGGATPVTYWFKGRDDVYEGSVATETGVTEAPTTEQNRAATSVEELLGAGVVIRLVATIGTVGGDDNSQVRLLCSRDKLGTAIDNLFGATIRGKSVLSVRVPRRATYF